MNTNHSQDELHALMLRHLEGGASPDDARALSAALRESAEARREYAALARQHAQLFEIAEERKVVVLDQARLDPTGGDPRHWPRWALGAAAVLMVCAGVIWFSRKAEIHERGPAFVAELRQSLGARWAAGSRRPEAGGNVLAGPLELEAGVAEFVFFSGAVLVVEGPAAFELVGVNHVLLRSGKALAEVPKGAEGFTIGTAAAKVVDLGTRFGVKVATNGVTEVQVFEGAVDVVTSSQQERLTQGTGAVVDAGAGTVAPVKVDAGQFPQAERVIGGLLAGGDFETGTRLAVGGMPKAPGIWRGDAAMLTNAFAGAKPREGRGMLRFLRVGDERSTNKLAGSDQWQLVELSGLQQDIGGVAFEVEAEAWFNAAAGATAGGDAFVLQVLALNTTPAELRWLSSKWLADTTAIVGSGSRQFRTDHDPGTWERLALKVSVPAEASHFLVHLYAAARGTNAAAAEAFPGQFADSVSLQLRLPPRASGSVAGR